MSASVEDIAKLRRMINEPTEATYTDEELAEYIELFPLIDADGYDPEETGWTATYDLNAAASEIWMEKAVAISAEFDFSADGGSFSRNQKYQAFVRNAALYAAKRKCKSIAVLKRPKEKTVFDEGTSLLNDTYVN